MAQDNKDKWIEDAFKKAQDKVSPKGITDESFKAFQEDFPKCMLAFKEAFGARAAVNMMLTMINEPDFIPFLTCVYGSGILHERMNNTEG